MPGTLYVVATPIGNLEDLTFRARRILGEVDLIAAEDTRRTANLLAHYEIRKPMVSLREHNETRESARIVERLRAGESVAVVTDAGTPGIADPGARLVNAVREAGLPIVPIPGPSAVTAAMSVAGSLHPEFTFMGFPPAKGQERDRWFDRLKAASHPVVFFEAPHRIHDALDRMTKLAVSPIIVTRELTKHHEQLAEHTNTLTNEPITAKGEFCLVALSHDSSDEQDMTSPDAQAAALDLFEGLTSGRAMADDLALELTALKFGIGQQEARKAIKKAKISVKQQKQAKEQ
jgi:16S rRNA (cytidine1402-2'-O)-methyltransferase